MLFSFLHSLVLSVSHSVTSCLRLNRRPGPPNADLANYYTRRVHYLCLNTPNAAVFLCLYQPIWQNIFFFWTIYIYIYIYTCSIISFKNIQRYAKKYIGRKYICINIFWNPFYQIIFFGPFIVFFFNFETFIYYYYFFHMGSYISQQFLGTKLFETLEMLSFVLIVNLPC